MRNRPTKKPISRQIGHRILVTDGTTLDETAVAKPSRPREGDIVAGLRTGLFLSAIIWAGLIIAAVYIFR